MTTTDRPPFSPLVPPLGEATVSDWLRHDLLRNAGVTRVDFEELEQAAWNKRCPLFESLVGRSDERFDELRMARLRMGHLRYGQRGRNFTDAPSSCIKRLEAYAETGNVEHLIDVFNLAEIEWVWPSREGTEFVADANNDYSYCGLNYVLDGLEDYQVFGWRNELVWVARWCFDEFFAPAHPRAHYSPTDDGIHAEETKS